VDDRREIIVQALHRCIREVGYARASLTAIAVKAKMSPSHIRYYFENRDAILEYYLENLCTQIVADLKAIQASDPHEWLEQFAAYYIINPRISRVGLSVLVEIFGVSVHHPRLREIKAAYDRDIRLMLQGYFERVGTISGVSAQLAAEVAQALEAGIKYNAVFEPGYEPERANAVFMAGIEHLVAGPSAQVGAPPGAGKMRAQPAE
jgi:AcrR family transcriptional regulator